ncbi:MAG: hypothetical protein FWG03_01555 [Clostridiales bacterium]|nr:hypothetical protein [Clostridiales bacterium]
MEHNGKAAGAIAFAKAKVTGAAKYLAAAYLRLEKKKYFLHTAVSCVAAAAVLGCLAVVFSGQAGQDGQGGPAGQGGDGAKPPPAPVAEEDGEDAQFVNYITPSIPVTITPLEADGNNCIPTGAAFLIAFLEPMDEESVAEGLLISPETDYTLEKTENGLEYIVRPGAELAQNTLYSLSFDPVQTEQGMPARPGNSFVFQTQKEFAVERVFPRDEGTHVEADSAIEIVFSNDINIGDLKEMVVFSPALEGAWEKTDINTYSFAAMGGLELGIVYEVSVKGGLSDSLGAGTLGEDYVFSFETNDYRRQDRGWFHVMHENNAFMESETPAFAIYHSGGGAKDEKIAAVVYQFGDIDAYAKEVNERLNFDSWSSLKRPEIDTSRLGRVYEAEIEIIEGNRQSIVVLPGPLPKGFYAVEFTLGGNSETSMFQVTNLSAYTMSDKADRLFWVNDLTSSLPVTGAGIDQIGGAPLGVTDSEGILRAKDQDNPGYRIEKDGQQLLVALASRGTEGGFNRLDYWRYIYADKPLYKPDDTLNFFGVMSPKLEGTGEVGKVTVAIEKGYWSDVKNSEIEVGVNVSGGVFEGRIELPDLAPGYYRLGFYYGEEYLGNTGIQVEMYKKPPFRIKLETDKPIMWAGEEATITATAEFFDGTPLADLDIELMGKKVKTGKDGTVSAPYRSKAGDTRWMTSREFVSASALTAEAGNVSKTLQIDCVNSDIEVSVTAKREGGACRLGVQAFNVDFSGLDNIGWDREIEYLKDHYGSVTVDVVMKRVVWDKVPTGNTWYDPYTKTYTEEYRYDRREEFESRQSVTVEGSGLQYFDLPVATDEYYEIELSGMDRGGRRFARSAYLMSGKKGFWGEGNKRYAIRSDRGGDSYNYYYYSSNYNYAIGDEVSLSVGAYINHEDFREFERGATLFVRASDKILDYTIKYDNLYNFVFDGSVLPNINVWGVHFDGREYFETDGAYPVRVDRSSRVLSVQVVPDKESYRPGETASITLKLTDAKGRPAKGFINVNVIDEALLAMREDRADINRDIFGYNNTYYFYPNTAVSHIVVAEDDGGGGAGNGGPDREDFRDALEFTTLETDDDGIAVLEVKMADNITSWRVIWQAFKPYDVMAGSGKSDIICTLPFFVDVRLSDEFLVTDKPRLGIRSAGTALAGGTADYSVEIPSIGFSRDVTGSAGGWQEIELPKLKQGEYSVRVSGRYGAHEDAVVTTINVVGSIATHRKTDTFALADGTGIDIPATGAVNLVISDKTKAQVINALNGIVSRRTIRVEQVIAKKTAERVFTEILNKGDGSGSWRWYGYGRGGIDDFDEKIAEYQNGGGGVCPFTYSDPVLKTTVLALAASGESFSRGAAAEYLYDFLEKGNTLALAGLAALKEPVMPYINELEQEPMSAETKFHVALAHIFLGDGGNARGLVSEVIAEKCDTAGNTMFCVENSREKIIESTADLAMAATLLDMEEGGMLFQYLLDNRGVEDRYLLQQVIILEHKAQSVNPDHTNISYTLAGEKTDVELCISFPLLVSAQQSREIEFSGIGDREIELSASYSAAGFPQGQSPLLTVSQTYPAAINSTERNTVLIGIDFCIEEEAPDGYYNIVHVLPAGLDFLGMRPGNFRTGVWISEVRGKQVTFTVLKDKHAEKKDFTFEARVSMTGSFTSEGTYITHATMPEFTNTAAGGQVIIR